jgi:predicted NUDIX family NTP pyrophosphohydrolase
MPRTSAGVLMYRKTSGELEVFLVHPGGPFWVKKDLAAWSMPKGEYQSGEEAAGAAAREFREETGFAITGPLRALGTVKQAGGKVVSAWCFEGDCDPAALVSNLCQIEWPPHSKRHIDFPEVDRGAWFNIALAKEHILKGQAPLLDLLVTLVQGDFQS